MTTGYTGLGVHCKGVVLFLFPRVDRARWIVALSEHKQTGVATPTAGKSACLIYQGSRFLKFTLNQLLGPDQTCNLLKWQLMTNVFSYLFMCKWFICHGRQCGVHRTDGSQ